MIILNSIALKVMACFSHECDNSSSVIVANKHTGFHLRGNLIRSFVSCCANLRTDGIPRRKNTMFCDLYTEDNDESTMSGDVATGFLWKVDDEMKMFLYSYGNAQCFPNTSNNAKLA